MSKWNRYIAALLLFAFTFVLVPKEAFHLLTDHTDTIDVYHSYSAISTKHTHCEILQFKFSGFTEPHPVIVPQLFVTSNLVIVPQPNVVIADAIDNSRSRAPPAVVA
jgi:hypothetical protein